MEITFLCSDKGLDALRDSEFDWVSPGSGTRLVHQSDCCRLRVSGPQTSQGYSPASLHEGEDFVVGMLGQLYNGHELKTRFEAHAAVSDAELVAIGLMKMGPESLRLIDGLFCMVAYNVLSGNVIAHVDRCGGIHRLLYATAREVLAISSQMHSLLALPQIDRRIRPEAVQELFATGYVLPPRSIADGVSKLGPGECLSSRYQHNPTVTLLDRIEPGHSHGRSSPGALEERLLNKIGRDCELPGRRAYLLSGGIDSGVIAALAARTAQGPIEAVSGTFRGSRLDESHYAKIIASHLGCEHRLVELGAPENLKALPQIVWHLGEPTLDFSVIPTFALFCRLKGTTDFVVSGDGPDHLFGRYYPLAAKRLIARRWLRSPLSQWIVRQGPGRGIAQKIIHSGRGTLLDAYRAVFAYPAWGTDDPKATQALLGDGDTRKRDVDEVLGARSYLADTLTPDRFRTYEQISDALTMTDFYVDGSYGVFQKVGALAAGLDLVLQEPFLGRHVIDHIVGLPPKWRVRGSASALLREQALNKYELKHFLAPRLLPPSIIRKQKGGFTPPLSIWLQEDLSSKTAMDWLPASFLATGLLDPKKLDRIIAEHSQGVRDWSVVLFLVLSLSVWYELFVARKPQREPEWSLGN